jgi:hypothetical protein
MDSTEENAGAEVSDRLFSLHSNLLICWCVLCRREPDVAEPSKAVEQKPFDTLVLPSVTAAFTSSPSVTVSNGGAGLTACNYADARSLA